MVNEKNAKVRLLVTGAVLTAMVVILQFMGAFVRFGPFSISLVLIPIVIGTATCGKKIGAWLGLVFGVVVLASGDAAAFLAVNPAGTVITVLLKGLLCGLFSGFVYEWSLKLFKGNSYFAAIAAAIACPLTNTGIFLVGCLLFFMDTISMWAAGAGLGGSVAHYMIFVLVGGNFLFELAINVIFAPVIVRIIKLAGKR